MNKVIGFKVNQKVTLRLRCKAFASWLKARWVLRAIAAFCNPNRYYSEPIDEKASKEDGSA